MAWRNPFYMKYVIQFKSKIESECECDDVRTYLEHEHELREINGNVIKLLFINIDPTVVPQIFNT